MGLTTGARVIRYRWTELPMPTDAIHRVNQLGRHQKMPTKVTFTDRTGTPFPGKELHPERVSVDHHLHDDEDQYHNEDSE